MPYAVYKVIHLSGIFLIVLPLGGVVFHVAMGGDRNNSGRRLMATVHGIGMLLALGGVLGMIQSLQLPWPWPVWLFMKFGIWLILGALIGLAYKAKKCPKSMLLFIWVLLTAAVYIALFKPFQASLMG